MTDGLWSALPSLTSIEELHCLSLCSSSNYSGSELSDALATLVQTSSSLAVISLAGISMEHQATKQLLAGLAENIVLGDLTLGMWVILETCRRELAQYLMLTPSLITLSYTGNSEKTEIAVLEGILCNRTISKVSISTFTGHAVSVMLLARILVGNSTIGSFATRYIRVGVSSLHHVFANIL